MQMSMAPFVGFLCIETILFDKDMERLHGIFFLSYLST